MQIKPLINIDWKGTTNQNILHIFTSMIDDLSRDIETESISALNETNDKIRLKAMHLALSHEENVTLTQLDLNVRSSKQCEDKLRKLINLVEKYEKYRMESIMFYIYFKVLNYLAHIYGDKIKNSKMAINYLKLARRMYDAFKVMDKFQSSGFCDTVHLFTKSSELKQMEMPDEQIEQLHSNNLHMMQILYADLNEMDNFFKIAHLILLRQRNTVENGSSPINWIFQIDDIVPNLFDQNRYKHAAAYLLLALSALKNSTSELDTKKLNDLHFNLVKHWILYNLLVFDYSKKNCNWKCLDAAEASTRQQNAFRSTDVEVGDSLTATRVSNKTKIGGDSNQCGDFIDEDYFMCFDSLQLNDSERKMCLNSLRNISDARNLFDYTITLAESLLQNEELINKPMDYVAVNYQLSDLYAFMLVFDDDAEINHHFQNSRLVAFEKMIKILNEKHPEIFQTLKLQMISDYNEILLDMLLNNLNRISSVSQFDFNIKEQKFKEKLAELRFLNNSIASITG